GTLMRKTHRQENVSTSQPPSNGPTAADTPARPDHARTVLDLSAGWSERVSSARLPGTNSAAATPCSARATTNVERVGAAPHTTDIAVSATTPMTNSLRRP